jgi:hypothetical protein
MLLKKQKKRQKTEDLHIHIIRFAFSIEIRKSTFTHLLDMKNAFFI